MNLVNRTDLRPMTGAKIFLVTGGCGFIGSHLAKRLHAMGVFVRIADIVPVAAQFRTELCSQHFSGDLRDPAFCATVVTNVHTVIHFAANMGGMGTIHDGNDFIIYRENHSITTNILQAAVQGGVHRFVYASSACVYPTHLQTTSETALRIREGDVWKNPPPTPQGLYGLEKLVGELLLHQFTEKLEIKVARFHNVYGPGGTWNGGREKVPAAFARKAVAAKLASERSTDFEIWGDGSQRRSFLYIDDAIEAVMRLLETDGTKTTNIGSENDITIQHLAILALSSAGIDPEHASFYYDTTRPIGVASRNADNELAKRELGGWEPAVSMEKGMKQTTDWIEAQIEHQVSSFDQGRRSSFLRSLQQSTVVHLEPQVVRFGIILPITSRGTEDPRICLNNLHRFAESLALTTRGGARPFGSTQFSIIIYIAVDHDDDFLLDGEKAESVLRSAGFWDVFRAVCKYPKGHVCALWRDCARRAWQDDCQYMMLLGDDVELIDGGWVHEVHEAFVDLSTRSKGPHGLGCVVLTDVTFPGMPTFPVIHRTHMDIFNGEVVPECFVNQDGDPFLFQLYRRFGTSRMIASRIRNNVGGNDAARYIKHHAKDWTYTPLRDAALTVSKWLDSYDYPVQKTLTIDVVIPSYRVNMGFLEPMLELKSNESCSVMWIIIVDDPESSAIKVLQRQYGERVDVRIRVNSANLGASASRNRGIMESAAEWIYFLDDDVTPHPDLLVEAEEAIRAHPEAVGFVGNSQFPIADTTFKTAVHLAGVTYFWDIATKLQEDIPWGVTANLIARRDAEDGVHFDDRFPKTGGGEDIDFCIRKRDYFVGKNMEGFRAAPKAVVTHPWWNNGARTYKRFYMWGKGDGALVFMFPQHCFWDYIPNSAELIFYSVILSFMGVISFLWRLSLLGIFGVIEAFLANNIHDVFLYLARLKTRDPRSMVSGLGWYLAVIEGGYIRIASEVGRLVGQLERGEFHFLRPQRRFDWFVGRVGRGPIDNEKTMSRQRFMIWCVFVTLTWFCLNCQ